MTDDVSDIDHIIDRIRAAHDAGTTLDEITARLGTLFNPAQPEPAILPSSQMTSVPCPLPPNSMALIIWWWLRASSSVL